MNTRHRRTLCTLAAALLPLLGTLAAPAQAADPASAPAYAGYGPGYGMGPGMMYGYGRGPGAWQRGAPDEDAGWGPGWRRGGEGCGYGSGYGHGYGYGSGWGMGRGMMGGGWGPGMMGGGWGPGMMGGGWGSGMMGGGWGPGAMMGGLGPRGLAQLKLSDAQVKKIEAIEEAQERKQWSLMSSMHDLMLSNWRSLERTDIDVDATMKTAKAMSELRLQMLRNRLETAKQVQGVLTAQQREQLQHFGPWGR